MKKSDIYKLTKIGEVLEKSTPVEVMNDQQKEKYVKILHRINADNKRNHIASIVKGSQTFIHHSTMGTDYYESLSPEMKFIVDTIDNAFDKDDSISEHYEKDVMRQIIVSNFEIDYAEQSQLTTADIRNKDNAYTIKPSNFKFNILNFLKYLTEMKLLMDGINEGNVIDVAYVALQTLSSLKNDFTKKISRECAEFLEFIYLRIGVGVEEHEQNAIEDYIKSKDEKMTKEYVADSVERPLIDLKVIDIVGGNIKIIEKVIL